MEIEPYGVSLSQAGLTSVGEARGAGCAGKAWTLKEKLLMRITDAESFGKAVRARRKALHYTQGYVSEVSGFSVSFISDLERGKETAELGRALYLAGLLGLDMELTER